MKAKTLSRLSLPASIIIFILILLGAIIILSIAIVSSSESNITSIPTTTPCAGPSTTRPPTTRPPTTRPPTTRPPTTRPITTRPPTTRPLTTRPPITIQPTSTPSSNIPESGVLRIQRVFPNILLNNENPNTIEVDNIELYDQNLQKIPSNQLLVTYGVASSFNQPEQNLIFNNNIVEFGPQNILNNMPNKVARTKGTEEFSKIFIQVRYQSQKISKIILKIDPNSPYAASLSKTQIQLYRQQDIVGNIPREQPVFISSFGPNLITNNRNELIINVNNETNKNCSNWEEYYCPFFTTQI